MQNIQLLEEQYLKAKIAYYEGEPILSDTEFDALEQLLKHNGSKVIEQVGSKRKDFDFAHPTKMLSLLKIQTETIENGTNYMEDEFHNWYNKRAKIIDRSVSLLASPKFDGNAINIIYRGTKLSSVLTRGDGSYGKDITKRFRKMIPNEISVRDLRINDSDTIEIRCEVVINIKTFNEKYSKDFANPRNYVAGVIGKDEEDDLKVSELSIIPLHFLVNGKHIEQRHFSPNILFGLNVNKMFIPDIYVSIIKSYEELRKAYEYQLDGVVISFPIQYREMLGENSHDPEWSVSVKFVPIEATTEYEGIEWSVSKRGEIIPTVLLKPVLLDGSVVKRASGYNASYILKKKIGIGALISIFKAGDIIPEIQNVVSVLDMTLDDLPKVCPSCGTKLEFNDVHLICTNTKCEGRIAKQLANALKILDIKRIGDKTIEPFAKNFLNMYELIRWVFLYGETPDIEQYDIKHGSRSQEIFVDAFKNMKSLNYEQVIQMLGYENVGNKISIQLAKEHAGLDFDYSHLERAVVEKIRDPKVSNYIKGVVEDLERMGIMIDRPKKKDNNGFGICMTGSPKTFGFKTKEDFLLQFTNIKEVSLSDPDCKYLITDSYESTSNKMGVAKKKGIEIRTYGDFKI